MENPFLKKQPQQSRSRSVVSALTSAVEQLLDRTGDLSAISVQKVANRAGVGIGSLYDYFTSREGLLGAFIQRLTGDNFEKMRAVIEETRGAPLAVLMERVNEATVELYLARPNTTRGAIVTIFRLGWISPVIVERDRFAGLLADRILEVRPDLPRERVEGTCLLVCDAVMGVVMTEVWRPRPDVLPRLIALSRAVLERELGLDLDA